MKGLHRSEIKEAKPQSLSILLPLPSFPQETWYDYGMRYGLSPEQVCTIQLIYFAAQGDLENLREIIEDFEFDVNSQVLEGFGNFKQRGALHYAQNAETVTYLASKGANLNLCDEKGRSPLMLAVLGNRENVVKKLLELGASLSIEDKSGESAQTLAAVMVAQACSAKSFVSSNLNREISQDLSLYKSLYKSWYKSLFEMINISQSPMLAIAKNETKSIAPNHNCQMEVFLSVSPKSYSLFVQLERLKKNIIAKNNFKKFLLNRFRETDIPALIAQAQWDREQQTSGASVRDIQGIKPSENRFVLLPEDNKTSAHSSKKRKLETQKERNYSP